MEGVEVLGDAPYPNMNFAGKFKVLLIPKLVQHVFSKKKQQQPCFIADCGLYIGTIHTVYVKGIEKREAKNWYKTFLLKITKFLTIHVENF